jgi:hypothetical protein
MSQVRLDDVNFQRDAGVEAEGSSTRADTPNCLLDRDFMKGSETIPSERQDVCEKGVGIGISVFARPLVGLGRSPVRARATVGEWAIVVRAQQEPLVNLDIRGAAFGSDTSPECPAGMARIDGGCREDDWRPQRAR